MPGSFIKLKMLVHRSCLWLLPTEIFVGGKKNFKNMWILVYTVSTHTEEARFCMPDIEPIKNIKQT